jgi:putative transposase
MKKSKFTEQQIVFALHQAETGVKVEEVCRKMGISEATFYNWKKKYGGLGVSELRRLKMLEKENIKLKQILADLSLDKQMLQDVLKKSSSNQPKTISGKSVSQGIQGISTQSLQSNNDVTRKLFIRAIGEYNTFSESFNIYPLVSYKFNAFTMFCAGMTRDYQEYNLDENNIQDNRAPVFCKAAVSFHTERDSLLLRFIALSSHSKKIKASC